jgi:hypothetical protein
MTNSINHPWGISKKMREKMGSTWADMDFEINPRLSAVNMKERLMEQPVGELILANLNIKFKYSDVMHLNKRMKKYISISHRSSIEEKFPVEVKSHTVFLNKKEIERLEETINITSKSLIRKYELGLYL